MLAPTKTTSTAMSETIDSFLFPIRRSDLDTYQAIARQVAAIWREYGATSYMEYVQDGPVMQGTRSYAEAAGAKEDEVVVFGWASFSSKEVRDSANQAVRQDKRMGALVGPLMNPSNPIFDPSRMVFGSFNPLVRSPE